MTVAAILVALSLAACARPAPKPKPPPPPPPPSADSLIAAIETAGARDASVVHVVPLRDPALQRVLAAAQRAEAAHDYRAAAKALDHALHMAPHGPGILQDRAELAIRLGHYAQAEALARRSFQLGPKLGSLCARNWQTVVEMRDIAHDPAGVKAAQKHLAACTEPGPVHP